MKKKWLIYVLVFTVPLCLFIFWPHSENAYNKGTGACVDLVGSECDGGEIIDKDPSYSIATFSYLTYGVPYVWYDKYELPGEPINNQKLLLDASLGMIAGIGAMYLAKYFLRKKVKK